MSATGTGTGTSTRNDGGTKAAVRAWPRVVLVDDEGGFRSALRELLQEEGIAVVGEARDGKSGLAEAEALQPDVVLMDLRMPTMDGIEATQRIKQVLPHTQVIILTAYEDASLTRSAEEVGAYAYLVKGCSGRLIRDLVIRAGHVKWSQEDRDFRQQ